MVSRSELSKATGNGSFWTDEDIPDPTPLPRIPGWNLLVRPIGFATKTKSGIFLPDQLKEEISLLRTVGRVLVVGDLAYSRKDMLVDGKVRPWCKVGDFIVFAKYGGDKFSYKGVRVVLLDEEQVKMTVDHPHDVNDLGD